MNYVLPRLYNEELFIAEFSLEFYQKIRNFKAEVSSLEYYGPNLAKEERSF
jgi:hypothetical protein